MSAPSTPTPAEPAPHDCQPLRRDLERLFLAAYDVGVADAVSVYSQGSNPRPRGVADGWAPLVDQAMAAVDRWA